MFIPSFNVLCDSAYMYIFMCNTEHNYYFIMTFYADFLHFCYRMASAESLASVTAQEKLLLHTYSVKLPQPITRDCEAAEYIAEYIETFPGRQPHGNSKKTSLTTSVCGQITWTKLKIKLCPTPQIMFGKT